MKKLSTFILANLLIITSIFAQSPQKVSYQAVVRNSSDALVTSTQVGMQISILQGSSSGTAVYVETQTPTTNVNGLVSIEIGTGVSSDDFSAIDWANGPFFIKTETDVEGGTTYSITGVSELLSVPFALLAKKAETLKDGATAGEMLYWNGTAWVAVAPGTTGQNLTYCDGVPTWGACPVYKPTVTTTAASAIELVTASAGGNVTSDGGAAVTERGVCWSTLHDPTTSDSKTSDASGTGSFSSAITGLTNGTVYYVRAFATNSEGTSYGEELSFETIGMGDYFQGGYIFYIDGTGAHGLISAPTDQSTGIFWAPEYLLTGATATAVGTGQANTTTIVNTYGVGTYAAQLCNDLDLNGYTDWFMPSLDEMSLMRTNLYLNGIGSFTADFPYWTSTEGAGSAPAYRIRFDNGFIGTYDKPNNQYLRAARAF
jgi:hypothetical protein